MLYTLIFLVALLIIVVVLNRRLLARGLGMGGSPCDWSRIHGRDREGRRAWFCPACGREELVEGTGPPPDCGARIGGRAPPP